ncbi:MAG: CZB domain-containing protein [Acidobacteria bacterium]|nr:CZB domain-containing protein [Acidobacteriota bacterium]
MSRAQDLSFATLVKVDHFLYKQNGYRVIHQGTTSPEARAVQADHRSCRLGTWYYEGQGAELFSHVPSYVRLEAPHADVHRNVHEAVAQLNGAWERNPATQSLIYAHFEAAERASETVMATIDRMVEERHRLG